MRFVRLDMNGAALGPVTDVTTIGHDPRVTAVGSNFVLTYTRRVSGFWEGAIRMVMADGTLTPGSLHGSDAVWVDSAYLEDSSTIMMTWSEHEEVFLQRFTPTLSPIGSAVMLANVETHASIRIADDESIAYVAFSAVEPAGDSLQYVRVGGDGIPLDATPQIASGSGANQPDVVFDGTHFVSVFEVAIVNGAFSTGRGFLRGTSVTPGGTNLYPPSGFIVEREDPILSSPAIASAGDGSALVVYNSTVGRRSDLRARFLGTPTTGAALGASCDASAECTSGFCVDGVCCESACIGTCDACGEAGMEGECVNISGAPRGDRDGCMMCVDGVCDDGMAGASATRASRTQSARAENAWTDSVVSAPAKARAKPATSRTRKACAPRSAEHRVAIGWAAMCARPAPVLTTAAWVSSATPAQRTSSAEPVTASMAFAVNVRVAGPARRVVSPGSKGCARRSAARPEVAERAARPATRAHATTERARAR